MSDPALPFRTRFAYGIGATAESAITMAFNTFNFLYYNNVLGLSGTLCGLAVTIALFFDAISDPIVGSISDRWRSRLGRRHPFLYAAPIPMALCFLCIYMPPEGLSDLPLFLWFTGFTVLLRTAQTLYQVPHLALGAEMTSGYRERSVLMSYNTIFGLIGTFGVFFLGWSWFGTLEGGTTNREGYAAMSVAIAAFSVFSIVAHWNDLYWPLIVISDIELATPPLGMLFFANAESGTNYGALMAAATILTAPLVIAFLFARRRFIQGITMTGVK